MGISLEGDQYWMKWIGFVRDALSCLDGTSWRHLPEDGGYYNQDEFIMSVWEEIRYFYIKTLNDDDFQNSLKVKNGPRKS